jgi:hypothetical protein
VELGVTLFVIMDETGILEEGQIYCVFEQHGKQVELVQHNVIITRCTALHPGDVQLVNAVSVPEDSPFRGLSNCVCFSQKGSRDLPSMLSGGDLDGDLYNILYDHKATLSKTCEPADYPRKDPIDIGRAVNTEDMTDFFVKFMAID